MPNIPEVCEFEVREDQIELKTRTNGDSIIINSLNLGQEVATSLAWLINNKTHDHRLKVEISLIEGE